MKTNSKYQVKCKLKKGDEVVAIAGRSKGQTGKIEIVDRKHGKIVVAGVNLGKKHVKPTAADQDGGIVEQEMPMPISNVALVDPKTKKPTRIGYKIEDGKKVRFAKKSGTILS